MNVSYQLMIEVLYDLLFDLQNFAKLRLFNDTFVRFGVMVRELELEYQQQVQEEIQTGETQRQEQADEELQGKRPNDLGLEKQELEKEEKEEDIKLKISKTSNGRFSVINWQT